MNAATAILNLLSSSFSSSSSDQRVKGFLAPPCSTFLETRRQSVSRSLLRAEPPGGLSQYCLTMMAENPPTPPKYSNTFSMTSAECGMFDPPLAIDLRNRSTPAASICSMSDCCWAFFLSAASRFCLAMQRRQSLENFPLPSRTL